MPQSKSSSDFFLKFSVTVSIFGIIFMPMLLLQSDKYQIDFPFTRILIGLLYAGICLLGISAVFYPKKCEKTFMFGKHGKLGVYGDHADLSKKIRFRGHHPDCEKFSANRIEIRKTVLCSSCAGLLVGAMSTFVGNLFYYFVGFVLIPADPRILLVSNAGMLIGLIQFKFGNYLKLIVNALFVLSSFLTLITVDLLSKNLLIDLYVLGLIVFLLLTRIALSEWNNKRICAKCEACELHE